MPATHPTRRTSRAAAAILTAGALALAGCSGSGDSGTSSTGASGTGSTGASAEASTRTVDTAFGKVTIPAHPKRAIALEGGVGPLLSAGITPVATMDGDYADSFLPQEYAKVKNLPIVLGKDGPDYEKIVSLKPDMMIGFVRGGKEKELSAEAKAQWTKLNAIAPTVLIRSTGSSQTKDATLTMSEALGDGDKARAAKAAYDAKAAEIKKTYAAVLAKNVFAPLDFYDQVNVYSPISWPGDTVLDAGGRLTKVSADERTENATFLSPEQLPKISDATVVLYEQTTDGKPGEGAAQMQKLPTYASLPAVKAGHAYGLPFFFADRYETGLKSLEGLENILKKLS